MEKTINVPKIDKSNGLLQTPDANPQDIRRQGNFRLIAQDGKITKVPLLDRRSGCDPKDAPVVGYADNFREVGGKLMCDTYVDPAKLGEDRTVFDIRKLVGSDIEGFWTSPVGVTDMKPFLQADLRASMIEIEKLTCESEQKEWNNYRNMLRADLGLNVPQTESYVKYIRERMEKGEDLVGKVVCLTMPVGEIIQRLREAGIHLPDDHKLKKQQVLNAALAVPLVIEPDTKAEKRNLAVLNEVQEEMLAAGIEINQKNVAECLEKKIEQRKVTREQIEKATYDITRPRSKPFTINRYVKLNLSPEEKAKLEASRSPEMPLGDPRVVGLWPKSDVEQLLAKIDGTVWEMKRDPVIMQAFAEAKTPSELRAAMGLPEPVNEEPITDYFSDGPSGLSDDYFKRGPSDEMKAAMTKTLNDMVVDYFDKNISRAILGENCLTKRDDETVLDFIRRTGTYPVEGGEGPPVVPEGTDPRCVLMSTPENWLRYRLIGGKEMVPYDVLQKILVSLVEDRKGKS